MVSTDSQPPNLSTTFRAWSLLESAITTEAIERYSEGLQRSKQPLRPRTDWALGS